MDNEIYLFLVKLITEFGRLDKKVLHLHDITLKIKEPLVQLERLSITAL